MIGEIKALDHPADSTEQEDVSRHGDTKAKRLEESNPDVLEPIKEGLVNDKHDEPCSGRLSKDSKRGKKRVASPETMRSKNWAAAETDILIKSKAKAWRDKRLWMGRNGISKGPVWEKISEIILGRTSDQCRLRWGTLVKSYKEIKMFCDGFNIQFSQAKEEDFRGLKLATSLKNADWYKIIDECYPWRLMSRHPPSSLNAGSTSSGSPGEFVAAGSRSFILDKMGSEVMTASPFDRSDIASGRIKGLVKHGPSVELDSLATTIFQNAVRPEIDLSETHSLVSSGIVHYSRKKCRRKFGNATNLGSLALLHKDAPQSSMRDQPHYITGLSVTLHNARL